MEDIKIKKALIRINDKIKTIDHLLGALDKNENLWLKWQHRNLVQLLSSLRREMNLISLGRATYLNKSSEGLARVKVDAIDLLSLTIDGDITLAVKEGKNYGYCRDKIYFGLDCCRRIQFDLVDAVDEFRSATRIVSRIDWNINRDVYGNDTVYFD